jgi:hypothetical protein
MTRETIRQCTITKNYHHHSNEELRIIIELYEQIGTSMLLIAPCNMQFLNQALLCVLLACEQGCAGPLEKSLTGGSCRWEQRMEQREERQRRRQQGQQQRLRDQGQHQRHQQRHQWRRERHQRAEDQSRGHNLPILGIPTVS